MSIHNFSLAEEPYHAPLISMRILGWNCCGICNALTVCALKASIRVAHPEVIFLSKTKASIERIDKVASLGRFLNYFVVGAR